MGLNDNSILYGEIKPTLFDFYRISLLDHQRNTTQQQKKRRVEEARDKRMAV